MSCIVFLLVPDVLTIEPRSISFKVYPSTCKLNTTNIGFSLLRCETYNNIYYQFSNFFVSYLTFSQFPHQLEMRECTILLCIVQLHVFISIYDMCSPRLAKQICHLLSTDTCGNTWHMHPSENKTLSDRWDKRKRWIIYPSQFIRRVSKLLQVVWTVL